jgi:hypothetical protein
LEKFFASDRTTTTFRRRSSQCSSTPRMVNISSTLRDRYTFLFYVLLPYLNSRDKLEWYFGKEIAILGF